MTGRESVVWARERKYANLHSDCEIRNYEPDAACLGVLVTCGGEIVEKVTVTEEAGYCR